MPPEQGYFAATHHSPDAKPQALTEVAVVRYQRFAERLSARLNDLQASDQPEIPRLVGHTLRLPNLLRDSWTQPTNSPPPALETGRATNGPGLVLCGEPYARYTLQYSDNLSVSGWTTTTTTDWLDEQTVSPPVSGGSKRFYRTAMPVP